MQKEVSDSIKNKSGQVTVFIIIAIIIIGAVVLFFFVFPGVKIIPGGFDEENPQGFMQTCINNRANEVVEKISLQGGSMEPEHYFTYNNVKIEYLCYTNKNMELCVVQEPLLRQKIESEIKNAITNDTEKCFNSLKKNYEEKGYSVKLDPGTVIVELQPKRIEINFSHVLTVSKGDTKRFDKFNIKLDNNLYELVSIANSIIEWEAILGDADPRIYTRADSNIEVNKNLRDEGTKIYTITELSSGDSFKLASRSLTPFIGY